VTPRGKKPRLVVDACVVLKWQLDDEDDLTQALALRDDYLIAEEVDLSAPTLLLFELANGVHKAARHARIADEVAQEALANLLACEIDLHMPDIERVLELALQHNIAAYDAAYLAVAEQLGAELWTADSPFYKAVRRKIPWVRWIADYAA
jgi:predicted nucleic acid-binding protein